MRVRRTVDAPVATPVFVRLSDGAAAITTLPVSLASAPSTAVTNAGTFATQVDGSALTALQLIDDPVFADDAAFTIGTSKVHMAGAVAVAHGAAPDTADALDAVALMTNRQRILYTLGGHPNLVSGEYITTASQADDNVLPAISAGTIYVVTSVSVTCSAANTVNTSVRLCFGTAIVAQGASAADATSKVILSHPGIAPGSGIVKGNGSGIVGIGGDGEELRIACSAPTTGSLVVQVDYFTIPEDRIRDLQSVLTIVNGMPVYAAGPFREHDAPAIPVLPEWSPVAKFGGYGAPLWDGRGAPSLSHRQEPRALGQLWGSGCDCFAF